MSAEQDAGAPSVELVKRAERLLGARVVDSVVRAGGYSPAERWSLALADGRRAFAKVGTTALTSEWLRTEYAQYATLELACMPALLGWDDHASRPLLLLEDLSEATWPPPWNARRIEQVRGELERLGGTRAPSTLPSIEERRPLLSGWLAVAEDPAPFLQLCLASEGWLEQALPQLLEAAQAAVLEGDSVVHFDVRSDNLCFVEDGVRLVDWNQAGRGAAGLDLAAWLPSLRAEGGPLPELLLPDGGAYAALLSGYFAARAGLEAPAGAPGVRDVQRRQLRAALPWAVRSLELPPLDGALPPID